VTVPRILRTANFRLALAFAMLFGVSVIALGMVMLYTTRSALERQLTTRVASESAALMNEYGTDSEGQGEMADAIRARIGGGRSMFYLLVGPDGTRVAGNLPTLSEPGWQEAVLPRLSAAQESRDVVRILATRMSDGALLAVGDSLGPLHDVEKDMLQASAWTLLATLVVALAGGLLLSMEFLRRVDAVTRTAEAIFDGDLKQRVPVNGVDDDFDRLAAALNRMLDRIGALMESLKQVSNDIAHDMRTPLARLRQRLELARTGAASVSEYEHAVDAAIGETDSILETFGALLGIAQIESGTARGRFRDVDLAEIVQFVVETFAPAAQDEGKALMAGELVPAPVLGDRQLLIQMLVNLVENAIRYAGPGTSIVLSIARSADGTLLAVADNGPGLPEPERSKVFQRFYRTDASRHSAGSGIGLALVKAVAELHSASIVLTDNAPGVRAEIFFPEGRAKVRTYGSS
jgi:signal transduction histidine kinase